MPADEGSRNHRDNLRVKTQSSNTSQEQSPLQEWESVDDANLTTDDKAPGNNAIQKGVETGMETGIWAMYGIKQPKRREILSQTMISSTHDVTMRLKQELNSDEWNKVYMLILESLAANYVEVRGRANLTWSNSPVSPVKIETTHKHEMSSTAEDIASSDNCKLPLRRNEIIHTDVAIEHAMEWMEAPKQLEESSETYRRCQVAAQRVRETPSRGDAASEASESISCILSLYPPPQ
jgi:hypothetical protein